MVIKAIGFDFDGTLIMSEGAKAEMMYAAFSKFFSLSKIEHKKLVVEYGKLVGKGNTRDKKVAILFKKIIGRTGNTSEKNKIAQAFGAEYKKSLNHCPLFACHQLVSQLQGKVEHLFLLSLEDQKEVQSVAKHCSLAVYFDEILGGPSDKVTHLKRLLKRWKLKPNEMLYIGDSHGDVVVGKKVRVPVILIDSKKSHRDLHRKLAVDFEVNSLCDVRSMIKQIIHSIQD
tara:strand:+ start:10837 stop:11523 length:687 start_codon:yes stop_codon:yes gene_type:complete